MSDTSDAESRVRAVIGSVFNLSPDQAASNLGMGNPPAWDSIGHMQLLVAIENEFDIRFQTYEIAGLVTVEAIIKAVQAHDGN